MTIFDEYRITSAYGNRKSPISGNPEFHTGIDLVKSHQAPIPAFVPGKVVHAKRGVSGSGFGGFGITVAVLDKHNALHCYCHLDSIAVAVGDVIQAGQPVGRQGDTGQSKGSHLHYEVRTKGTAASYGYGSHTDPGKYLLDYLAKEKPKKTSFADVPAGAWYEEAIAEAVADGYLAGYPDGTFKPDAPLTRAQGAVLYARQKQIKR